MDNEGVKGRLKAVLAEKGQSVNMLAKVWCSMVLN